MNRLELDRAATARLATAPSPGFAEWLAELGGVLLLACPASHQLVTLAAGPDGTIGADATTLAGARLVAAVGQQVCAAGGHVLWRFTREFQPAPAAAAGDAARFVARNARLTGELRLEDLALRADGEAFFVSRLFSCVAVLDPHRGFRPVWWPPFVRELAAEDRCGLSGIALVDGAPRFATAWSASDAPGGWRRRAVSGVVVDVASGEIVASGLDRPRAPRHHASGVLLLDAGARSLLRLDGARAEPLVRFAGTPVGLTCAGRWAIVTLVAADGPGAIADSGSEGPRRGVAVVDLESATLVHALELDEHDPSCVAVLDGVPDLELVGPAEEALRRRVAFTDDGKAQVHLLPVVEKLADGMPRFGVPAPAAASRGTARGDTGVATAAVPSDAFEPRRAPRDDSAPAGDAAAAVEVRVRADVPLAVVLGPLRRLVFPDLRPLAASRSVREPLIAAVATLGGRPIGGALAELGRDLSGAPVTELLSLFVVPAHRQHGVAARLLAALEAELVRRGVRELGAAVRTHWPDHAAALRLYERRGWSAPQRRRLMLEFSARGTDEKWFHRRPLPSPLTLAPWAEVTPAERARLAERVATGEVPAALSPLQAPERVEPVSSLVLREGDAIAGWMVTHRVGRDTVQYTAMWVEPRLRRRARGLDLAFGAVARQLAAGIPFGTLMVDVDNLPMLQLVERRFSPHARRQADILWTAKRLDREEPNDPP